jgi:hypothetical protein
MLGAEWVIGARVEIRLSDRKQVIKQLAGLLAERYQAP